MKRKRRKKTKKKKEREKLNSNIKYKTLFISFDFLFSDLFAFYSFIVIIRLQQLIIKIIS